VKPVSLVLIVLLTSCATPPLIVHDPITGESQTVSPLEFGLALGYIGQEIGPMVRTYYAANGVVPASMADLQSFAGVDYPLPFAERFCAIQSTQSGERVSVTVTMLYPHKSGDHIIGEGRSGCSDPVSWVLALTEEQLASDRAAGREVQSTVEISRN
jgi:hypothetical protein